MTGDPHLTRAEQIAAYKREWRARNQDKIKQQRKDYRANNKAKINAYRNEYRANNKAMFAEAARVDRARNHEKRIAHQREYRANNRARHIEWNRKWREADRARRKVAAQEAESIARVMQSIAVLPPTREQTKILQRCMLAEAVRNTAALPIIETRSEAQS